MSQKYLKLISGWFKYSWLFENLVTPKHTSLYSYFLNTQPIDGIITLSESTGLIIISSSDRKELENIIVSLSRRGFIRILERPDEGENEYRLYVLSRMGGWSKRNESDKPKPAMSIIGFIENQDDEIRKRRQLPSIAIEDAETSATLKLWFSTIEKKPLRVQHTAMLSWIDMQTHLGYSPSLGDILIFPKNAILFSQNKGEIIADLINEGFIKENDKISNLNYISIF